MADSLLYFSCQVLLPLRFHMDYLHSSDRLHLPSIESESNFDGNSKTGVQMVPFSSSIKLYSWHRWIFDFDGNDNGAEFDL